MVYRGVNSPHKNWSPLCGLPPYIYIVLFLALQTFKWSSSLLRFPPSNKKIIPSNIFQLTTTGGRISTPLVNAISKTLKHYLTFLNCYLAVPQPILGHCQGEILTNPVLLAVLWRYRPEGQGWIEDWFQGAAKFY